MPGSSELGDLSTPLGRAWQDISSWIKHHGQSLSDLNIRVNTSRACNRENLEMDSLIEAIQLSPAHSASPEGRRLVNVFNKAIV